MYTHVYIHIIDIIIVYICIVYMFTLYLYFDLRPGSSRTRASNGSCFSSPVSASRLANYSERDN